MIAFLLAALVIALPTDPGAHSEQAQAYYHFSLAQFLRHEGEQERAVEELRKALEYDPESSSLHFSLAQSLADTGLLEESIDECKKAIELDSDNPDPHFLFGLIYKNLFQRGRSQVLEPAIQELARAVELDPRNVDALSALGQLYLVAQYWEDAARTYQELRALRPDIHRVDLFQAQALANLGRTEEAIDVLQDPSEDPASQFDRLVLLAQLYASAERFDDAIDAYEQAAELTPEGQNRWNLQFTLGGLLIHQSRFTEAEEVLRKVVEGGSTDPQALVELGKAQEGSRHYPAAVESFRRVLKQEPNNEEANYYMASSLRNLGRRDEAIERLHHLLSLSDPASASPSPATQSSRTRLRQFLGVLYQETRQHEMAIELFRDLCKDQPDDVHAKLGLVYALKEGGRLDEARKLSSELVAKKPADLDILITHARILSSDGELDAAAQLLKEELRRKQESSPGGEEVEECYLSVSQLYSEHRHYDMARQVLEEGLAQKPGSQALIFNLGSVFERLNQIATAEEQFKKVLAENPEHSAALNYLGYMLADRELRLEEALGYIERALAQDPHNGAYLDSLGWVYFKLNKFELAEENLKQAVQINDRDPTILEHLGDLYLRLGDHFRALDYYRKSVALAEDPEELEKVEAKLASLEKEFPEKSRYREEND
jgi:tetratricopeptide (TPR) repeat protein